VARDRKRAKQRRERRGPAAAPSARNSAQAQAPSGGDGLRADVPGALGHASAEVDEFDAALLRGAGGVPATDEADLELAEPGLADTGLADSGVAASGLAESPLLDEEAEITEDDDGGEDLLQAPDVPGGDGGSGSGGGDSGGGGSSAGGERPSGAPLRGGNRAIAFLRASWAELQRVQWPDRRHVTQATAVVLGFVAIAGAYLGLADYVAKEIVEFIL
jgi:preprotein translocase SecE subunit